ncbi:MAG: dephospho-CoA kinase [Clostridia bacterium]|nr:dephospho-CoA kinase [Clostridia bacterium]
MKIIGITGASGCGKGAVAQIMSHKGALILDCDKIAHDNMEPSGIAYKDIAEAFGSEILNEDKTINRKALGSIVFNDSKKLSLLNSITHKYIVEAIDRSIALNRDKRFIVIDAPLLVEAGLQSRCDSVWAVYAPVEMRIERVMSRDGIDRESALLRFKNQRSFEDIKAYADVVITNDGDLEKLEKKVEEIMNNKELF